jgi:putative peptidoglycan lipid II flippase
MLSGIMANCMQLIEQVVAFGLGGGSVSILNYGNKIPLAVSSLFVTVVGLVVLPNFSELVINKQWKSCRSMHLYLSVIVACGGIALAGAMIFYSEPVIRFLFERGRFNSHDTKNVAGIMSVYMMQLPFQLIVIISSRALFALGENGAVAFCTILQLVMSASLYFTLSGYFGVLGIAAGTLGGTTVSAIAAYWITSSKFIYLVKKSPEL